MTVRSDESPKILDGLIDCVDEVVAVIVTASAEVLEQWRRALDSLQIPTKTIAILPYTRPDLYELDVPETFAAGEPLCDEIYSGPFSGQPFVADWSTVRNMGWDSCSMRWKLAMTSDEVMIGAENLRSLCACLDEQGRDVAHLPQSDGKRRYSPSRLARNDAGTTIENAAREVLVGGQRAAVTCDCPRICSLSKQSEDLRDQVSTRSLYADARRSNWIVPHNSLLELARSTVKAQPLLSDALLDLFLQSSPEAEERSWALAMRGEICESLGKLTDAVRWYASSIEAHPGWKSPMRLSRVLFKQSLWRECVDAYDSALVNYPHLRDDGSLLPTTSLILVAASLHKLGKIAEARRIGSSLVELFPESPSVVNFYRHVTGA